MLLHTSASSRPAACYCFAIFSAPYQPLGVASGFIQNNQFSASSTFSYTNGNFYPPWQARLGNDVDTVVGREARFWGPENADSDIWIQVIIMRQYGAHLRERTVE